MYQGWRRTLAMFLGDFDYHCLHKLFNNEKEIRYALVLKLMQYEKQEKMVLDPKTKKKTHTR